MFVMNLVQLSNRLVSNLDLLFWTQDGGRNCASAFAYAWISELQDCAAITAQRNDTGQKRLKISSNHTTGCYACKFVGLDFLSGAALGQHSI